MGTPPPYDPGSHSKDRKTERNASMFGPPGHAYVYLSYGVHYAINLVCSPTGTASAVLLRAGEIVEGEDLAVKRRTAKRHQAANGRSPAPINHAQLARGPGNLGTALGITRPNMTGWTCSLPRSIWNCPPSGRKHCPRPPGRGRRDRRRHRFPVAVLDSRGSDRIRLPPRTQRRCLAPRCGTRCL
nr:DNA-3-methyladenine glycosylase [Arthrobacter sp. JCM 19049]